MCCSATVWPRHPRSQSQSPGMAHHTSPANVRPAQLTSDGYNDTVTFTRPHEIIPITSILLVSRESVCRSELTYDTHLAVYAVSKQPATESPTQVTQRGPKPLK